VQKGGKQVAALLHFEKDHAIFASLQKVSESR